MVEVVLEWVDFDCYLIDLNCYLDCYVALAVLVDFANFEELADDAGDEGDDVAYDVIQLCCEELQIFV